MPGIFTCCGCAPKLTIDRDQFIRELESRNIGTSVHFFPSISIPIIATNTVMLPVIFRGYEITGACSACR